MPDDNTSTVSLVERFMLLPTVLSFVVALAALLAISHDVGYFWFIDINFLSFLTTSDLIKSTAGWVPLIIPFMFVAIFVNKILGPEAPFLGFYIQQNTVNRSTVHEFWNLIKNNKPQVVFVCAFLYFMLFDVSYQFSLMFFLMFVLAIIGARSLNKHFALVSRFVTRTKYAASSILALAIFIIGVLLGWADAAGDLRATSPAYRLKSDGAEASIILIVRSGEKGIIYRQDSTIGFIPWDNIKGVSRISPPIKIESLPRHIYRWFTDQPPPIP